MLKRQARSRARAADHRKEVAPAVTRARQKKEQAGSTMTRLLQMMGWTSCGMTVVGSVVRAEPSIRRRRSSCGGWVKGEKCGLHWRRCMSSYAPAGPPRRMSPNTRKAAKRARIVTVLSRALEEPDSWWCERCWAGNLCFREKCYRCSLLRPEVEEGSSDDGHRPRPSAQVSEAVQFLTQTKRRSKKGRSGTKHRKAKSHKKMRRARKKGCAVGRSS